VHGYSGFLLDFLQVLEPGETCAAAFDESLGSCFRNDIYSDYKASRTLPDEALAFQLDTCRTITESLGIPSFSDSRYEADDFIATLARRVREQGCPVTVVTRDKDLGQVLVSDGDRWWDFAADAVLDAAAFTERFGVKPGQFADYLALVGDPIDDVPGVPGVGPKSAACLLQHFGSLHALAEGLSEVAGLKLRGAARLEQRLREHWPAVLLARQLTGLESAIPDVERPAPFELEASRLRDTADLLQDLGIGDALTARYRRVAGEVRAA
jgi:5'-3' exonuclease